LYYAPQQLPSHLPPRHVADIFVDRFFADVNDLLCILSYNDFMSWFHPSYPDKPLEPIKQVILYIVFAFGSKDDIKGSADTYFSYAQGAVGPIMAQGGLEAIQTLTLLVRYLFLFVNWKALYSMHEAGGVGSWTYAGAAIRVAQSMNLLQDNEFPHSPDRDLRRRVWWTLYDLERY
jgi:Fungal specific transcription factor domain